MNNSKEIYEYQYIDQKIGQERAKVLKKMFEKKEINSKELLFFDLNMYSFDNDKNNSLKLLLTSKLDENISLNNHQLEILNIMHEDNIFLSAPTSFGKTFIVLEYIKLNEDELKNIIFIVPTLALMNELLKKIYKYFGKSFNICINNFEHFENKNIFIFVPERTDEKFLENLTKIEIDLMIFDEIYKLSEKTKGDERLIYMNKIYFDLVKKSKKIFLLGPFIKEVSFSRTDLNIVKFFTNFTAVYSDITNISDEENWTKFINYENKTLVYFESPENIYKSSDAVIQSKNLSKNYTNLFSEEIEFLEKNFHKDWYVIEFLKKGIGIHHGKIPIFLRRFFENEYNKKNSLNVLFCTSTLMEGINTPSNKLIIVDSPNDTFKYNNLIGRIGRLNPSNPIKGEILIFDKKCLQLAKEKENWLELKILAETEKISKEEEILYLNKESSKNKIANSYKNIMKFLQDNKISKENIRKYNIKLKILEKFLKDSYVKKFESATTLHNVIEISLKLLGCKIGHFFKTNNFFDLNTKYEYLGYKYYIEDLLNKKRISEIIENFNNEVNINLNKYNISIFVDRLFILINYIKFNLVKILDYLEITNTKIENKSFNKFINLLKAYNYITGDKIDKILDDLGIEQSDFQTIKKILNLTDETKISTSLVISNIKKNSNIILSNENINCFTKKNIKNL